jgi:tRNA threonylcarbamoyl adenosine modification protein YeaZ
MKILAVEFSSRHRSAAVIDASADKTRLTLGEAVDTGARSTSALTLVESALHEARLEREQVQCLAVGLGPGSYTGIRAAISLAQGWQLATGVRLLGISSAECLAMEARLLGLRGPVHVVIDAQRGEFYLAGYELEDGGPRETESLRLANEKEVNRAASLGLLVGPDVAAWPEAKILYPHASTLGALAAQRTDYTAGEKLEPVYLRQTQFLKAPPRRILPSW